jgi:hypothetical protein
MVTATATAAGQRCSPGVRRAHAGSCSDPFRLTGWSVPDALRTRGDPAERHVRFAGISAVRTGPAQPYGGARVGRLIVVVGFDGVELVDVASVTSAFDYAVAPHP